LITINNKKLFFKNATNATNATSVKKILPKFTSSTERYTISLFNGALPAKKNNSLHRAKDPPEGSLVGTHSSTASIGQWIFYW